MKLTLCTIPSLRMSSKARTKKDLTELSFYFSYKFEYRYKLNEGIYVKCIVYSKVLLKKKAGCNHYK